MTNYSLALVRAGMSSKPNDGRATSVETCSNTSSEATNLEGTMFSPEPGYKAKHALQFLSKFNRTPDCEDVSLLGSKNDDF